MPHAHDHGPLRHEHGPNPGHPEALGRLRLVLALTVAFMAVELGYGLYSGSLALLSDAGHMLTDAASLALSLGALTFATLPPTSRRTYGWLRLEILAALINAIGLLVLGLWVIAEAIGRLEDPQPLPGRPLMVIAVLGLAINIAGMALLHRDSGHSLNIRGAFLHVAGDAIGSVGVLLAGY
ncbi:MAG TPA: cation diffusion facilitator family transporter, partial [bacterium]|nr:cation diffusion facilitator family transporter [bacterium]